MKAIMLAELPDATIFGVFTDICEASKWWAYVYSIARNKPRGVYSNHFRDYYCDSKEFLDSYYGYDDFPDIYGCNEHFCYTRIEKNGTELTCENYKHGAIIFLRG